MNEEVELQLLSMMLVDDTKFTLRNGGVFDFEGAIKQAEEYAKDGLAKFMKQSHDNVREVALYLHKIETMSHEQLAHGHDNTNPLYLVTYYWDSSDGWEGGDTGTNVLFATTRKEEVDTYLASLKSTTVDLDNVQVIAVKMNTDYLSEIGPETETSVVSGYDYGPTYDDPYDV